MGSFQLSSGGSVTNIVTTTTLPRGVRRIGVMADSGAVSPHRDALAGVLMNRTEMIVLGGDQNYGPAAADVVPNNAVFNGFPVRAVEGNHDIDFDGGVAHRARFTGRPTSPAGLPGCYHEVVAGGMIDLVVLQSGRTTGWTQTVVGGVGVGSPMNLWFLSLLPTLTAPHLVVAFHHPTWGPVDDTNEYEAQLDWPWHTYGVKLVLVGHSHISWVGSKNGVKFLCAAATYSASAALAPILHGAPHAATLEWVQDQGYAAAILTATSGDLVYEFVDTTGVAVHSGHCGAMSLQTCHEVYEVRGPSTDLVAEHTILYTATVPHYIHNVSLSTISTGLADIVVYVGDTPLIGTTSLATLKHQRLSVNYGMKETLVLPGQQVKYRVWTAYGGVVPVGLSIGVESRSVA